MASVRKQIIDMFAAAISPLLEAAGHPAPDASSIELEIPKTRQHGDYASNIAFSLTRQLKRSPRDIAAQIVGRLDDSQGILQKIEIAGPGFINVFVRASAIHGILEDILAAGSRYGRQDIGNGARVQVEFVSANPTGPLHIGHGRGAATGDAVASILESCGYSVEREYYINDAGNQMNTLGRSLYYRYQELVGEPVDFPEGHYRGDYMKVLAGEFIQETGGRYRRASIDDVLPVFTAYVSNRILDGIKEDLSDFGIAFDTWFSEQSLHDEDAIRTTVAELKERGFVYESEGAVWFRSTAFSDEKDRVVVRANGISTYFAADLAYHKNKYERGYKMVVDIWGADHHGYVDRMKAGAQALGRDPSDLKIILVQLVNLLRGGKPVAMSTRAGEFVTLKEVVDEVGRDAARFIFLTRRSDSPLDFDLDVAKMQSNDNPVFYVQYAHARLCSIFEVAKERGISLEWMESGEMPFLSLLAGPQELELLRLLGEYPELLARSARSLEPHLIPYYLHELVSLFHSYYNQNRVLGDDPDVTQARLYLAAALRTVIHNGLEILGVHAPEKM